MAPIHSNAAAGFSSGTDRYVRGRPDYPSALGDWLRDGLALGPGKTVLELGAGTGKFTARLAACGAKVTALEPVAAMRQQLQAFLPQIPVLASHADAIPLPDESQDAVLVAQAFHWFATPEALAEIRRVLKPGGFLGLVWNCRDERLPWVATLTEIMRPYARDCPVFASRRWQKLFPAPGFSSLQEESFPHSHKGPSEQVILDRVLSVSYIASLAPKERAKVTQRLQQLIAGTPTLAQAAEVEFPYVTFAFSCQKNSKSPNT